MAIRKVNPEKFMAKIVGDTGEQILKKVSREIGNVNVNVDKGEFTVEFLTPADGAFSGRAKSLRAALMIPLKEWARLVK